MVDCPTGAIGRDPEGEVFIRDALCTGCGACAKACPWDNIQMAQRPAGTLRPEGGAYPELAVKCDLCRTYDRGPACVQACPTGSIFRINPTEEIADLRELLGRDRRESRSAAAPTRPAVVAGATIAAIGFGATGAVMQSRGALTAKGGVGYAAGVVAAAGFLALLAYLVPKRGIRIWMRAPRWKTSASRPRVASVVRPHATLHTVIGVLTMATVLAHAPWPPAGRASVGGALYAAFFLSAFAGCGTGLAYRFLPRYLARLERTAALPEDFAGARRALLDRLYREVTGRSDLVKKIVDKMLLPYATSAFGPIALLLSRRTLREEEEVVRGRIDRVLEGRGAERLAGLKELVRTVVELRSLPAQRLLLAGLRVGLPVHVVTFGVATVLLLLHVIGVVRQPP
jgi:ferredoxin